MDITKLSLSEAKSMLRLVRLYKDLTKKLGKRGRALFHHEVDGTHSYIVEYFSNLDQWYVLEKAFSVYSQIFWVQPKKEDIVLLAKEQLLSWIKVYYDDACVDLSFKNIEYKLSKA